MQLWADLYTSDGMTRLGGGAVPLLSAAITRQLDGIGRIAFTAAGSDPRTALIEPERHVRLFAAVPDESAVGVTVREIGCGMIRRVRAEGNAAHDWRLSIEGADDLDALTRVNTLLGRAYRQQTPTAIAAALTGLISGWSASGSGGSLTDARFDGMSLWRALLSLADAQGLHIRAGVDDCTVEIGAFGDDSGVRLIKPGALQEPKQSATTGLIESIERETTSDAAATRLFPVGAGIGEALLTLERSTRTSPYVVHSTPGADGRPQYYLEDAAGMAAYGVIERFGKFKQIAPLSNSPLDLEHAANALYDLAAAWLRRYALRQDTYRVVCRGLTTALRPGDTVRVVYRGVVERGGQIIDYVNLDADLWIMRVTERAGIDGHSTELLLASVDRHAPDESPLNVGGLEAITIDGVSVTSYFNRVAYVYDRLIDPSHAAIIPVRLTDATQKLSRCTLKVKTRPFTATATGASGGGITGLATSSAGGGSGGASDGSVTIGETADGFTGSYYWRNVALDNGAGGTINALIALESESGAVTIGGAVSGITGITIDPHSHLFSVPDHAHDLTYGLHQDSVTPSSLRLHVNGVDVTDSLGGAWAAGGGSTTFEVDVTAALIAGGDLQREHEIKLTCGGGRGSVEVSVEIYEVIAAIAL
ncbi:MAG: hypothetical protein U0670_16395 [Anaerolineae bacterium]